MLFRRCCLAVIAVVCWYVDAVPAADNPEDSFIAVVKVHFKQWDLNHDGVLSAREVDSLLLNPAVTGEAAAALAAVHIYQRGHKDARGKKDWPALSLVVLTQPEQPGPEERRDVAQKRPQFESHFRAFRTHIHDSPRAVFADKTLTLTGFHQGHIGDCFFLAAVASAVHRNPAAVQKMFQVHADGSCQLIFPHGKLVPVRPLTDGLIALGSSAGVQGLWLNVLEQGFAQIRLAQDHKGAVSPLALDEINQGGTPLEAIEILTGHVARRLAIRHNGRVPPEREIPALLHEARTILNTAFERRHLVCCGTFSGQHPPGIVSQHVYSVLGFNARTDSVTVRNPWGNQFEPQGPPGLKNGYPTKDGVFEISLKEFVHAFDGISYETAEALRR